MTPAEVVAAAEAVPGWCEPKELGILAEWASECRRIVEVGVYQGRTTTAMGLALPEGGRLYAVDDFRGEPVDRPEMTPDLLWQAFWQHCEPLISAGRVAVLKMTSLAAAAYLAKTWPLDLVYLDGSHDYQSVCADIDAWLPLIRPGGRLCGHDAWQEGVRQALDALLPGRWQSVTNHLWSYEVPA